MKTIIFIVLVYLVVTQAAQGESLNSGMFVNLDVNYFQLRDESLNRLRNTGIGLGLQVGYLSKTRNYGYHTGFTFPVALLLNRYGHMGASIKPNLFYVGEWGIEQHRSNNKFYLGPYLSAHYRSYYHVQWDDSHLYWLTDYSIGPNLAISFDRYRHHLKLSVRGALLSLISRSPGRRLNKIDNFTSVTGLVSQTHEDMHFAYFWELRHFQIELRYRKNAKTKRIWFYLLDFTSTNESAHYIDISHTVSIQFVL